MCRQTPLLTTGDDAAKHRSGVNYTIRLLDGLDMEVTVPVHIML